MKKILTIASLLFSLMLTAQPKQPNIIVFIADDWGWEESTPYSNGYIHTPNIQRLAKEGMRFDNFFLTASSCSPSRTSIMTGLYPHNAGTGNLHVDLPANADIFPLRLKDTGYHTMLVGKSHGTNKKEMQAKFGYVQMVNWGKPWDMANMWLTALEQRPKDKPFFLWAASIDPHRPFRQGEYPYKHSPDSVTVPPYYPDIPEVRKDLANYYDEIGRFDEHIGTVLKYLEEKGELDNTFIVAMTDNGRAFAQCKTRVNVQGLKSPLIIRYPKLAKKGSSCQSLVSAVDLAPTLLQLASAPVLPSAQGFNFLPLLKNPSASIRDVAFGEHNWHSYMAYERAAITKDFVYIRNWLPDLPATPPGEVVPMPSYQVVQRMYEHDSLDKKYADCFIAPRPGEELFAVKKDIHCMNNLATDKKQAAALKKMQKALDDWRSKTGDVFPGRDKLKKDGPDRKRGDANSKEKEG